MYLYPKTKIGKVSFYMGMIAFVVFFLQYWAGMLFDIRLFFPGILVMLCIVVAGITAAAAMIKFRDRAVLLFIPLAVGISGILFILGEFSSPH